MRIAYILLLAVLLVAAVAPAPAFQDVPEATLKIPPLAPEKSVSTYIPSEAAPGGGLAVNIIYPMRVRYKEGAPVVVVVPGGEGASGLEFSTHASQAGFVEVRFAFPGGGKRGFSSAGTYDYRGPNCQTALRDVLLFASGKLNDLQQHSINQVVPVKVDNRDLGIIGWSNGGNTVVITLSKFAEQLPFVDFVVFVETPLGSLFYPPSLGSAQDLIQNPHYRQGTAATGHCLVDFRKLCWQPEGQKQAGVHKKSGTPEVEGVLFFDENGNKSWDEDLEFALPYSSVPGLNKQIYPPEVTRACQRFKVFGAAWPKQVANIVLSERYFNERDGSLYFKDLASARPDLLVCVFGSQLDRLQRQPDHPHIALNYNNWLANKQKFVRLNPDPVYVGFIAGMNQGNFVNNRPNSSVDATEIENYLEPEGIIPDWLFVESACAELADRKYKNNFTPKLDAPLVNYWNGILAAPAGSKEASTPALK